MIRLVLAMFLLLAGPLWAQDAKAPIVETRLEQSEVVPGQAATLRLTVLVPTWMPGPPDLPGFEAPNLRVRVPPNGSTAVSRRVGGETWSGVSRRYLLTPMVPGQFTLPPQTIRLSYIGPDGTTPVTADLQTEAILITGTVPAGAEGLDPFIAADALTLTQEFSGPTAGLKPGDSVIRTLTAQIDGASPIVLPAMLPQIRSPAIRVYPSSPQVNEDSDNDRLSGTRVESETLMALGGGEVQAPPVNIDWFNLTTGKVESAEVPGFDITVLGPPPKAAAPHRLPDWRLILALAALLGLGGVMLRRIWPVAGRALRARRADRLGSAAHARRKLLAAISRRDYPMTTHWLVEWRMRLADPDPSAMRNIANLMARLGATIYRRDAAALAGQEWADLHTAIRSGAARAEDSSVILPDINPGKPMMSHARHR